MTTPYTRAEVETASWIGCQRDRLLATIDALLEAETRALRLSNALAEFRAGKTRADNSHPLMERAMPVIRFTSTARAHLLDCGIALRVECVTLRTQLTAAQADLAPLRAQLAAEQAAHAVTRLGGEYWVRVAGEERARAEARQIDIEATQADLTRADLTAADALLRETERANVAEEARLVAEQAAAGYRDAFECGVDGGLSCANSARAHHEGKWCRACLLAAYRALLLADETLRA